MKKNKIRKRLKTDEWNEMNRDREEEKTQEEDNDWNKKDDEDKEEGENASDFHEENYDN